MKDTSVTKKKKHSYALLLVIIFGIFFGFSLFTFFYAGGHSYLRDDPQACLNCHVMRSQFDAWNRSSHHQAASCNDCHTPKNIVKKYAVKAISGWNHGSAFTTGDFNEPIIIQPSNRNIVLKNCLRCHGKFVSRTPINKPGETKGDCIHCHGNVGHRNRR
ncbi:MAG: cytochrome c nitrite reductase small subunit [Candidatus Aminicenantes bacterium]|nr:cytochrome c nitrite reductase small subunit [Candidatus Aminicenantes bacterium]